MTFVRCFLGAFGVVSGACLALLLFEDVARRIRDGKAEKENDTD